MHIDFNKLESYRRRHRERLYGALGAAGLTPLFRFHAKRISTDIKQAAQLAGVVAALHDEAQRHELDLRGAFNGFSPTLDFKRVALASGFGAFEQGTEAGPTFGYTLPGLPSDIQCPSNDPPVCCVMQDDGTMRMSDPGYMGSCMIGTLRCRSVCAALGQSTEAKKRAACYAKFGPAPQWYVDYVNRGNVTEDPNWTAQCQRNFPRADQDCSWNPANEQHFRCRTVDTSLLGSIVSFFNDAWDTVKGLGADIWECFSDDWLKCAQSIAKKISRYLGFPVGTLLAIIANLDVVVRCVKNLLNGSANLEQTASCFRQFLTTVLAESVPWDELMIAANVLIGNVPGAVVLAAKVVVGYVRDHIVNPTVRLVLDIAVASQDLVSLILSSGADAFRSTAGWALIAGAIITVAEPRAAADANWNKALKVGNAINRNTALIVKTINEPSSIVAYVKTKYIDPAQAMVTATVGKVANVAGFASDFKGSGDAFEDTAYMLSGLGGVLFSLGDALDDIPFVSGVGGEFKAVGGVMKAGAADVRKASRLVQEVGSVLTTPPSQLAAKVQAAIDRAVALGLSDPSVFLEEAERAYNEAKQAVDSAQSELTSGWQLPGAATSAQQQVEQATVAACLQAEGRGEALTDSCKQALCAAIARGDMNPAFATQYGCGSVAPAVPILAKGAKVSVSTTATPITSSGSALPPSGEAPPPAPPPAAAAKGSAVGPAIVGGVIGALVGGPVGAAVGAGILGAIASKR